MAQKTTANGSGSLTPEVLLSAELRVPDHVVLRAFPAETVAFDLNRGKYVSLNPTGGRFLEAVERAGSFRAALERLQREFPDEQPATVHADLYAFVADLAERGLIEIVRREVA